MAVTTGKNSLKIGNDVRYCRKYLVPYDFANSYLTSLRTKIPQTGSAAIPGSVSLGPLSPIHVQNPRELNRVENYVVRVNLRRSIVIAAHFRRRAIRARWLFPKKI